MSTCITTYSGHHFDPSAPDPALFDIRDIAHALSLTCRGNGHVQQFFSVGQHCIWCCREAEARGYAPRIALACLLHDASEAYMSDVPRPFKKQMPTYCRAEAQLLQLIYEKYLGTPLTLEEAALVRAIDDDVLWYDLAVLLRDPPARPAPILKIPADYREFPFSRVEAEYLALFSRLTETLASTAHK